MNDTNIQKEIQLFYDAYEAKYGRDWVDVSNVSFYSKDKLLKKKHEEYNEQEYRDKKCFLRTYRNIVRVCPKKPYLNIGPGRWRHPEWFVLDILSGHYKRLHAYIDINHDLMDKRPIPIEDDFMEVVYMSHVIEHLPNEEALHVLQELHRLMKKNGVLRIVAPDADLFYDKYMAKDEYWYNEVAFNREKYRKWDYTRKFLAVFYPYYIYRYPKILDDRRIKKYTAKGIDKIFHTMPKEDALNYFLPKVTELAYRLQASYPELHVNWWNLDKTSEFLKKAGFDNIIRQKRDTSASEIILNTKGLNGSHPESSFYIEAVK